VQGKAIKRTPPPATGQPQKKHSVLENHLAKFIPVRDSRNRRLRGLYQRNGRYYAQLWVDRGYGKKSARRFPLFTSDNLPARTLREAKEALEIKRHERREDTLPLIGHKPIFGSTVYWRPLRQQHWFSLPRLSFEIAIMCSRKQSM